MTTNNCELSIHDAGAVSVHDLEHDSRVIKPGSLFACIPGKQVDGHDYARAAVEAGAVAVLAQRPLPVSLPVPVLTVRSVRRILGPAAVAVHEFPGEKVDLIGVTGTNGKTTTVRLIAQILSSAGFGTSEIGTLTNLRTTPEAPNLQRLIADAVHRGDDAVVMEVSSHALDQYRVDGCDFRVAVFTNLGHDHLDYHGSIEAYFQAKARLFNKDITRKAVINVTTSAGRRLANAVASEIPVIEVDEHRAAPVSVGLRSSRFQWRGELVHLPLGGAFNMANAVMAAETAVALGLTPRLVAEALAEVSRVPGRFELVEAGQDFAVVVDYAHTPEGIKSLLKSARTLTDGHLTVVFGAGGDRDSSKRSAMGRVAEAYADRVIVTSDNPRSEDPHRIIVEIVDGMRRRPDCVEVDRRLAVRHAIAGASPGDVIVIAGKGHEKVQAVGHEVLEFDDRLVAREELDRRVGWLEKVPEKVEALS